MTAPLPTNDANSALDQAARTASLYLSRAIESIDSKLGDGYAAKHPDLIAGFMQAAAIDYAAWQQGVCAAHVARAIQEIDVTLGEGIRNLGISIESTAPIDS